MRSLKEQAVCFFCFAPDFIVIAAGRLFFLRLFIFFMTGECFGVGNLQLNLKDYGEL